MKNKFYSKNHIYIIVFISIGFLYSIYSLLNYNNLISESNLIEKTVISQSCRAYTKLASGVTIKNGNKIYNVKLDYDNCIKYPTNSKIYIIYDKQKDAFIFPVKNYNTGRIYFLGILFLISLIPWNYLLRKDKI